MSGPEARKPDDAMLEEFLAGDGRLVRAYRSGENPTAPPALDDVILKIARDELGRPMIVRASDTRRRRLRLPIAAAATLVLSFSVLLAVQRDREASRMAFEMAPPAAPAVAPVVVLEEVAPLVAEPLPTVAPPPIPQSPALAKSLAAAPPPAAEFKDNRAREDALLREQDSGYGEQPAADSAPAPSQAAESSSKPRARAEKRERQMMAPAAAGAMAQRTQADESEQLEPADAWLRRIRQLQNSQRYEEARRELQAFRQAYPDYRLPEDFRALEAEPASAAPPQP